MNKGTRMCGKNNVRKVELQPLFMLLSCVVNKLMEMDGCENECIIVKEFEVDLPSVISVESSPELKN
jgi:hypothetical protein